MLQDRERATDSGLPFTLGKKLATLVHHRAHFEITSAAKTPLVSFGVEDRIADGIVVMGDVEHMGPVRFLRVVKMRGDAAQPCKHSIELTQLGVSTPMLRGRGSNRTRWGPDHVRTRPHRRTTHRSRSAPSVRWPLKFLRGHGQHHAPAHPVLRHGWRHISASRGAVEVVQAFESIGVDVSNISSLTSFRRAFWVTRMSPTPTYFVDSPIV